MMSGPLSHGNAPVSDVARLLITSFESGSLGPGQKLPSERRLCELMGVGRSKLREAMKSLELLGLVEQRVGDGTYLAGMSSELLPETIAWGVLLGDRDTAQLLEMRRLVTVEAAGWAAERRLPEQLEHLHELCAAMAADPDRFGDANAAFHRLIGEASGNGVLSGTVANLHSLLLVRINRVEDARQTLAEYELLLKAIDVEDATTARASMAVHVERVARKIRAFGTDN
ncbi:FadR/GntR family transcriptional regulator [Amycolatopsis jejuensis]|uniref:FadR/GntR family transcriptional regulator n=1 Tax=Amycolatopsis jejuensis TaxID=330084 RepID=UPI000524BD65|nr:FadR/GntR family transcriptional regulator [Amycolatopsis jejuensis]